MRLDPWRDSCPDFPDLMTRLSTLKLLARLCKLGPNPDAAQPWRDSFPHFPDLMSRLSRLEPSAQICNLSLNLDAARPLARFLSRFFRPYDKTFKVETLGANMPFVSKSGWGATNPTYLQTF